MFPRSLCELFTGKDACQMGKSHWSILSILYVVPASVKSAGMIFLSLLYQLLLPGGDGGQYAYIERKLFCTV